MLSLISSLLVAVAVVGVDSHFCLPDSYEGYSFVTLNLEDRYIASDYSIGRIYTAPVDEVGKGTEFTLMDLKENRIYNKANGACVFFDFPASVLYGQCMPEDLTVVKKIGYKEEDGDEDNCESLVVNYVVGQFNFTTVIQHVPDTDFIIPTITRTYIGNELQEVNVHYNNKVGVEDPSVFEPDVSDCKPLPTPAPSS